MQHAIKKTKTKTGQNCPKPVIFGYIINIATNFPFPATKKNEPCAYGFNCSFAAL